MTFFSELKRRNVIRVSGVYALVGWLLLQVAGALEEAMALPAWFDSFVLAILLIGFPLAAIFAWAFELTPEGIKRTAEVDPTESITAQTGSKMDVALVIGLFAFAAAILVPRFLPRDTTSAGPAVAVSEGGGAEVDASAEASIAVLPFADLSPGGDQEYFADGISEELLNVLAQLQGLKVTGRTSSFSFKGQNTDLREIGEVLNVAHILEGSVRTQGNRIRVTAQLIQVSDGFHLWSANYDRDLEDIFAVQDDIAQNIAQALRDRLQLQTTDASQVRRTDTEAYRLVLEARDLIHRRELPAFEQAIYRLDDALAIDPGYAPAYAARATVLQLQMSYGGAERSKVLPQVHQDIETALSLEPGLSEARAIQGLVELRTGANDQAIAILTDVVRQNPNSLNARHWLSGALLSSGRARDALLQIDRVIAQDPLFVQASRSRALILWELGRVGEALRELTKNRGEVVAGPALLVFSVGMDPRAVGFEVGEYMQAWGQAHTGEHEDAVARVREMMTPSNSASAADGVYLEVLGATGDSGLIVEWFDAHHKQDVAAAVAALWPTIELSGTTFELAEAFQVAGRASEAAEVLRRAKERLDKLDAGTYRPSILDKKLAEYWALVGDAQKSIGALERVLAARPIPVWVLRQSRFNALRDVKGFIDVVERNRLVVNEGRAAVGWDPLPENYADPAVDIW